MLPHAFEAADFHAFPPSPWYESYISHSDWLECETTPKLLNELCVVVAVAFAATCPEDGLWPVSEGGIDIVVNCPQGTYGRMSRYCMMTKNGTAEWQEAKMESCLPLTPEPGMAFIDMIYNVSQSRARFIEYRPSGFADAIAYVYRVNKTAVSVHRIAEEVDMVGLPAIAICISFYE